MENKPVHSTIRNAKPAEYTAVGSLLVTAYSQLDGFPSPIEQPEYYKTLANIGQLLQAPGTEILVAADNNNTILGCMVYYANMQYYGPHEITIQEENAAGLRLLAVRTEMQGLGIGKQLTLAGIEKARAQGKAQVILHSTTAMKTAWAMYEKMGFTRSEDIDFFQSGLGVYGFRFAIL